MNPTGGEANNVTVTNPNDFYEPILKALNDSGGAEVEPAAALREAYPAGETDTGKAGDLAGKAAQLKDQNTLIKNTAVSKLEALKITFAALPTNIGTVSSLNLGGSTFGQQYSSIITLADWADQIALLRSVIKWAMFIGFAMMTLRAFGWQH
jgi:hypothetical protein